MAQLVARDFWEVEVAGSSPVTQTRLFFGAWRSPVARTYGVREVRSSNLLAPTKIVVFLGVAQLVARSVRDAEVVGSSPITQTIFVRITFDMVK